LDFEDKKCEKIWNLSIKYKESPNKGIVVDGTTFKAPLPTLPVHFCRLDDTWKICSDADWNNRERRPMQYGPAVQVIDGPVVIVYGTIGTSTETSLRFSRAIYLANQLYYQERYSIAVYADTDYLPFADSNATNVILLGGPRTNAVAAKFQKEFPVTFTGNSFTLGPATFRDPSTGIIFLSPWFYETLSLVIEGTDDVGFAKAFKMFPFKSGITTPDYAVAGHDWDWKGDSGLLAAGFWDNFWKFSDRIGYLAM